MNEIYKFVLQRMNQYQKLSPSVADFFEKYFEMFSQRDGCKESNSFFAKMENISISTIEVRFKKLREAKIVDTILSKFYDPLTANNKSGYITIRTNKLNPLFKSELESKVRIVKEKLAEKRMREAAKNDNN